MSKMRMFVGIAIMAMLAFLIPVLGQDAQAQQPKPDQAQPQEGTLKLTVKYTGSEGPVDETHKLLVFIFDTPNIGPGQMPIKFESLAENGGTLTMTFTVSPVYVAAVYDKPGGYDFSGPPASGSPITIYMKEPPTPAPITIEPGKTAEVTVQFDDSMKMP